MIKKVLVTLLVTVDTEDEENFPADDYEPTDEEMMASFGTKWHDGL